MYVCMVLYVCIRACAFCSCVFIFYMYVCMYVYVCNWSANNDMVQEAMRVIREQHELGRPFFLNLWFDAPHRCLSTL